jgi:hypothetical protein
MLSTVDFMIIRQKVKGEGAILKICVINYDVSESTKAAGLMQKASFFPPPRTRHVPVSRSSTLARTVLFGMLTSYLVQISNFGLMTGRQNTK